MGSIQCNDLCWCYFEVCMLEKIGRCSEVQVVYCEVVCVVIFYGFFVVDQFGQFYMLCLWEFNDSRQVQVVVVCDLVIVCVMELFKIECSGWVVVEWNDVLSCYDIMQCCIVVEVVCDNGWFDCVVFLFGKILDEQCLYVLCFLFYYDDIICCELLCNVIDLVWVVVEICVESIFNLKVCLLVNVMGLMQVLFVIGVSVVKLIGLVNYGGVVSLYDLDINIVIGIVYLC